MNEKVEKYFKIANSLGMNDTNKYDVIEKLLEEGASYAIVIKVLLIFNYNNAEINSIVLNSESLGKIKISAEDLFFDLIELDDDIIDTDEGK